MKRLLGVLPPATHCSGSRIARVKNGSGHVFGGCSRGCLNFAIQNIAIEHPWAMASICFLVECGATPAAENRLRASGASRVPCALTRLKLVGIRPSSGKCKRWQLHTAFIWCTHAVFGCAPNPGAGKQRDARMQPIWQVRSDGRACGENRDTDEGQANETAQATASGAA